MVGFAEGTFVGTEEGEFVGAAVGSSKGATDGPTAVGWEEVGVSVVGFAEGASVGTTTCPRFVSLKAPPTTSPFFTCGQVVSAQMTSAFS